MKKVFMKRFPDIRTPAVRLIAVLLVFSLAFLPFTAMGQTRGYGQPLGSKADIGAGGAEKMQERRFLQRGRLMPGRESPEEMREMAGFTQSVVTYQVHVLGEVGIPGTFRVNPSTRVDEMLKKAGGVNPLGSNRKIKVKRQGGREFDVDITDFRRNGNLQSNPYLLDNDVVFVPFAEKVVRFEGAVRMGGVVELNHERTLKDALNTVGGMTLDALLSEPITVVRFDETGDRQLIKVDNDVESLQNFDVKNGDMIFVPNVITKGKIFDFNLEDIPGGKTFYPSAKDAVFVIGSVSAPGAYPFNPFSSAEEYVLYAGPTKSSALQGIRIKTVGGKLIRGRKNSNRHTISPGDLIIVPEKIITVDKGLMWYNTFASTVMTGLALRSILK